MPNILLLQALVCIHPMIVSELACGHLKNRAQLMSLWNNLPFVIEAGDDEAIFCLNSHKLMGKGIGLVDLHLLASALLTPNTTLLTKDRRLSSIAQSLQLKYPTR